VVEQLNGQYRIMVQLTPALHPQRGASVYGGGLRLLEVLRLRVKNIDFDARTITLRETKSNRDRTTCLPESVITALMLHLAKIKAQHTIDLAEGRGEVELPLALDHKYPSAPFEWAWQYVFPTNGFSKDPRSGHIRRHHVFETSVQRAVQQAAKRLALPNTWVRTRYVIPSQPDCLSLATTPSTCGSGQVFGLFRSYLVIRISKPR
jgi:integrase